MYTIPDDTTNENASSMVNEPAAAYYTRPMITGLRNYLVNRITAEQDVATLLQIEALMARGDQVTFADKYARMKAYAHTHFPKDFAEEMQRHNFYIDQLQPTNEDEFDDLDKMFAESEASGVCTEEEVKNMFNV